MDEATSGMVYMRARWQDPLTARFTTPDPARDFDPYKPATYNAYQYVHNNPIDFVDPTGLGVGEDQQELGWQYWQDGNYILGMFHNFVGAAYISLAWDAGTEIVDPNTPQNEKITATADAAMIILSWGISREASRVVMSSVDDFFRTSNSAFKNLEHASKYGIKPFKELRKLVPRGSGLERHHLIEKRFADILEKKQGDMLSIVLTKAEHLVFTNKWRKAIPYGNSTLMATAESIKQNARIIYKDYPEILKALGLK